jgi:hypothetical protein
MGVEGQSHVSDVMLVVTVTLVALPPYTHLKGYGDHKHYVTDMALSPYTHLKC